MPKLFNSTKHVLIVLVFISILTSVDCHARQCGESHSQRWPIIRYLFLYAADYEQFRHKDFGIDFFSLLPIQPLLIDLLQVVIFESIIPVFIYHAANVIYPKVTKLSSFQEWGSTTRIAIGRHFLRNCNCSTQKLQLVDTVSTSCPKKWQLVKIFVTVNVNAQFFPYRNWKHILMTIYRPNLT